MEYIWSLEEELEDDDDVWNGGDPEHPDAECDYYKDLYYKFSTFETPDKWFAYEVERRAMDLWQGEQVDGSTFKFDLYGVSAWTWPGAKYFMDTPSAVMAGYRYLLPCCKTLVTLRGEHYRRRWPWPKSLEIGHSAQCILVYAPTSAQDKIV